MIEREESDKIGNCGKVKRKKGEKQKLYNKNRNYPDCNCKILGNKKCPPKKLVFRISVNYLQK